MRPETNLCPSLWIQVPRATSSKTVSPSRTNAKSIARDRVNTKYTGDAHFAIRGGKVVFEDVLLAEGVTKNIASAPEMLRPGHEVVFKDEGSHIKCSSGRILKLRHDHNTFYLDVNKFFLDVNKQVLDHVSGPDGLVAPLAEPSMTPHERMGHSQHYPLGQGVASHTP